MSELITEIYPDGRQLSYRKFADFDGYPDDEFTKELKLLCWVQQHQPPSEDLRNSGIPVFYKEANTSTRFLFLTPEGLLDPYTKEII